jgi:hypothetical protein
MVHCSVFLLQICNSLIHRQLLTLVSAGAFLPSGTLIWLWRASQARTLVDYCASFVDENAALLAKTG